MNDDTVTPSSEVAGDDKRWQRVLDCVALKQPDRMPVAFWTHFWLAKYGNVSFKDLMYDHAGAGDLAERACLEFQPDLFDPSTLVGGFGPMLETARFKQVEWPGHGVPDNRPVQYLDREYMTAEEYDDFLLDPTGFYFAKYLPRVTGAYEGFEPLGSMAGSIFFDIALSSCLFTLPSVKKSIEELTRVGEDAQRWIASELAFRQRMANLGYPNGIGGTTLAPYDFICDVFRGATGMMKDLYRHGDKLLEVFDRVCALELRRIKSTPPLLGSRLVFIPIHWAPDAYMSQKQFERFYWPSLRKLLIGLIDAGRIPWVFWESDCTKRWEVIMDVPPGKCLYMFEKGDLVKAHEVMGDVVALRGNVKSTTMCKGTPEQVDAEVKHLVDNIWNKGGNLILDIAFGIPDEAPLENVRAFFNAARKYGG